MVARVLVKISAGRDNLKSLMSLREWCRRHTKKEFCSYALHHYLNRDHQFVVFEFECEKEAMKFQLYTGM
jgi:hypothetical protein